jgi:prepilin-type processing-associated H-X9-DG protein
MNNENQLIKAMVMYGGDNFDLFPPNPDDPGNTDLGYHWVTGDAAVPGGTSTLTTTIAASQMTDPDYISNPTYDLIAIYTASSLGVFKCPADPRVGVYDGSDPNRKGTVIPAVRSISMNQGVGTIDPQYNSSGNGHRGKPTFPVNGPWLTGTHGGNHAGSGPYATFGKFTDFGFCSASMVFTTVDENPWSINDAGLAVIAQVPEAVDFPSDMHANGCGFAFADGHSEVHQWKSTFYHLSGIPSGSKSAGAVGSLAYADWLWVASHATKNLKTGGVP